MKMSHYREYVKIADCVTLVRSAEDYSVYEFESGWTVEIADISVVQEPYVAVTYMHPTYDRCVIQDRIYPNGSRKVRVDERFWSLSHTDDVEHISEYWFGVGDFHPAFSQLTTRCHTRNVIQKHFIGTNRQAIKAEVWTKEKDEWQNKTNCTSLG